MMGVGGKNGMRKGMAGLLALLLFVFFAVSAMPAPAWPTSPAGRAGGRHAVADCGSHGADAVPAPPEQEPRRGHSDRVPPALRPPRDAA